MYAIVSQDGYFMLYSAMPDNSYANKYQVWRVRELQGDEVATIDMSLLLGRYAGKWIAKVERV